MKRESNQPDGDEETGQGALIVSFGAVNRVVELQRQLHEIELKQIEAQQNLGKQLLDAQIESAKANKNLAVAAVKLSEASQHKP